jgi:predicted nucleic acid-binding protein
VNEAWVVNASPLILFARIGWLDLIERLAPATLIPNAVIEEVRAGQVKDRTAAVALEWAEQDRVADLSLGASIEHWDLGLGESQVIANSVRAPRWAVLDDRGLVVVRWRTESRSSDRSAWSCVPRRIGM